MTKTNRKRASRRFSYANQHAGIRSYPNPAAAIGGNTFTANREDELFASISTDSSNASELTLAFGPAALALSGRQARTLQRLLNKHFANCGASMAALGADDFVA